MTSTPINPMNPAKEALGRAVIAEIEERRHQAKKGKRRAAWRFAFIIGWAVVVGGVGGYLQLTHVAISGAEACGFFLMYLASSAVGEYRTQEQLRELRAELDELKDRLRDRQS
jgi:hypothetical protein